MGKLKIVGKLVTATTSPWETCRRTSLPMSYRVLGPLRTGKLGTVTCSSCREVVSHNDYSLPYQFNSSNLFSTVTSIL